MPTPEEAMESATGSAAAAASAAADERTPLLSANSNDNGVAVAPEDPRQPLYNFLEAKTGAGRVYEKFMMILIAVNVLAFIIGSLFVEKYNPEPWASRETGLCQNLCDALWFGNYADNDLQFLNLGSTSVLEIVTVIIFTVEYVLRLYTIDFEDPARYSGWLGRLRSIPTFFSLVDLAATLPFYIDAFFLRETDLAASQFLRMFRLLRMMRVEGRFDTALTMVDDVYHQQKGLLGTAGFVGITVWLAVSSLYYLAERRNFDMVYCSSCPDLDAEKDCTIDEWGIVECADCTGCFNFYESIPMASYYALLNLFGEFPHMVGHSVGGMIVGVATAVVAVAVFALPVGIIGNGFEDVVAAKANVDEDSPIQEEGGMTVGFQADETTLRGRLYNLLHAQTVPGARALDNFINILIVSTSLAFMLDTVQTLSGSTHAFLDSFELLSVLVFTAEYTVRLYSAKEDPKYNGTGGRIKYMITFLAVVDLLSFLPYWIQMVATGGASMITRTSDSGSTFSTVVKSLRLLRIFRFEKYTHAFLTFDDVIRRHIDVLAITAFTAILFWIFFSACLYFSERDTLDPEMASNYNNIPNAMWVTLLNLSGESPLSEYSFWGKVVTAILGLFATGVFGIPIGVLGAGFEAIVSSENQDNTEELQRGGGTYFNALPEGIGSSIERACYHFVNGLGSVWAARFELMIYALILLSVAVGAWQTVPGQENSFHEIEWIAVVLFTIEYCLRLVGAGADPEFSGSGGVMARLRFVVSFYSVIDLLAIVPFYVALAMPESLVNDYDEYLRMLRILRLVKLDKYIPSITLIDDVIRLKFNTLRVAMYAAITLWILFASALYICEHKDHWNEMDPDPLYGCTEDCTMSDRFQNFFDSMIYTGIHLTGDFPIITYSWPARFVLFLVVIAAVGVVTIPSGVIASGFVEILQSKKKMRLGGQPRVVGGVAGDDWYEISYRELEGVQPPSSPFGTTVDKWQIAVNEFLNGKETEVGRNRWTKWSFAGRVFIFTVIITNVIAVLAESVPTIDKAVGNEAGNFFDRFEFFSVMVFAVEYILRLFCAPKNREALYSTTVYATTFFGIVDFLSTAPWFVEQGLIASGLLDATGDNARIFRIFRIFRILQLEDFVVAFSKLDNVFRASKDVLKATGLMALIVWVGCGALFFIFEENNPNWRSCDDSIPAHSSNPRRPGCFDFGTTADCNEFYPGMCEQKVFTDMPNSLFCVAVFLGGEWGVVDFTWPGRFVCMFLCVVGIALYSIPIGTLFDSFGAVLGLAGDDDEEEEEEEENDNQEAAS